MIQLSLPSERQNLYLHWNSCFVGPFDPTGTELMDKVSIRSNLDSLTPGGTGLFHENNVAHQQYSGELEIIPAYNDIKPAPLDSTPDRISYTCINMRTGLPETQFVEHGLAAIGAVTVKKTSSYFYQRTYTIITLDTVEYYEVGAAFVSPTGRPSIKKVRIQLNKFTGKIANVFAYNWESGSLETDNAKWYVKRSASEIIARCEPRWALVAPWTQQAQTDLLKAKTPVSLRVADVIGGIDSFIRYNLHKEGDNLILPLVHYGELASQASAKVNKNDVNMIAFLKDLRDPKALIPKLRQLTKLKTNAGNFLAINYGVLPTVSDIQTIVGAFKAIKPYIDKNGFSTYNAMHSDSIDVDNRQHSLEQRIKIAIEDEDSEFVDFANKIHSSGFAPTLENIWDLVPYSFVIDWFLGIGDMLERIDTRLRLLRLNIRYSTLSEKRIVSMVVKPSTSFPVSGIISAVAYHRWTIDHSPLPPLSFSSEVTVSDHWLEAGALIIQRTK